MNNTNIGIALGLITTRDKLDSSDHSKISKYLDGQLALGKDKLIFLAEYIELDKAFGTAEEAARALTDQEIPTLLEFEKRLLRTDWVDPTQLKAGILATRHQLLANFQGFASYTCDGIRLGSDLAVTAAPPGLTRGLRAPQPEDKDGNLPTFRMGEHLKVRLDINAPRWLVLLLVSPWQEDTYSYGITCLAPSFLAPENPVKPASTGAVILPTQECEGLTCYVVDRPIGRYDLIATLSNEPIDPLPWSIPDTQLHYPSKFEANAFLNTLMQASDHGHKVEIRHYAFNVISGN